MTWLLLAEPVKPHNLCVLRRRIVVAVIAVFVLVGLVMRLEPQAELDRGVHEGAHGIEGITSGSGWLPKFSVMEKPSSVTSRFSNQCWMTTVISAG